MIKAVIFDFGGTLDTNGIHWSEKFRMTYEEARLNIKPEDFNEAYVKAEPKMYETVLENDDLFATIQKQSYLQLVYLVENKGYKFYNSPGVVATDISMRCCNYVNKCIANVIPLLEEFKDRIKYSLVSNFYGNIKSVLRSLDIDNYFDSIIDSTTVNIRKPDARIFSLALSELKIKAEHTIAVGDSYERDILPAKNLGCKTAWLNVQSWTMPKDISAADFIMKDIKDLRNIINKLNID